MKKLFHPPRLNRFLAFVSLLCLGLISATVLSAPKIDQIAPDFNATDSHGKTHKLSDYRGQYVILEWTNHQCPYVRKHYGSQNMQSLQKMAQENGVVWLSIISSAPGKEGYVDAAEANRQSEIRQAKPTAVLLDPQGEIGRLYKAKTTPQMFIIDPQGVLRYMGGIDSIRSSNPADIDRAEPYTKQALEQLLAGRPVKKPVTPPYGCSVKY